MNLRDIAGNTEEEEDEIYLGMQKKKKENPRDIAGNVEEGEPQRYSWERRRRRTPEI